MGQLDEAHILFGKGEFAVGARILSDVEGRQGSIQPVFYTSYVNSNYFGMMVGVLKSITPFSAVALLLASASCQAINKDTTEAYTTSNGVLFEAPAHYPAFFWDEVPVYMMFADGERLLQESEVRKISSETDFICIEKNHGLQPHRGCGIGLGA